MNEDSDNSVVVAKNALEGWDKYGSAVDAYRAYRGACLDGFKQKLLYMQSMDAKKQALLEDYKEHISELQKLIVENSKITEMIVQEGHKNGMFEEDDMKRNKKSVVTLWDISKCQETLKLLARDWSEEGREERRKCYEPIIREIKNRYPHDKNSIKVLVPSAGLCRLVWDLSKEGYLCEGNEMSPFKLLAINFALNCCEEGRKIELYPWVHQSNNHFKCEDRLQRITIPDVDNQNLADPFSLNTEPFHDSYKEGEAEFDCVATCVFREGGVDAVEVIQRIYRILKPGGTWINVGSFGPDEPESMDPPYDLLKSLIQKVGFRYLKEEQLSDISFSQNPRSMLLYNYSCMFFVCEKPA